MESIIEMMHSSLFTEGSYQKADVLDSCYRALSEGVDDLEVIMTTSSYTQSMILEILENVKDGLIKLYQQIVSILNNYILNTANLADKYRNLLIDRFITLKDPFVFKTYEYPKLKDKNYPAAQKSAHAVKDKVVALENRIISDNLASSQISEAIYDMLISFGNDVVDGRVSPYDDLAESVREIVVDHIRGREITRTLTQRDIGDFIDEVIKHREFRDDLNRTKTNVLSDYENLKRTYMDLMKRKESESVGLKSLKYPETEAFKLSDRERFSTINLMLTQLFDGYITIYREAFNTKLSIMRDKVEDNRAILTELMVRTNVFTSINAKTPNRNRRPIIFDPSLKA